ncbi:putative glycolipid-binding domain-containing protein (plasmid) [Chryseobacterium panacisoli]|uniref:Putative glycolipid-binding domain-containing protein n=1 Tax=Chryseobacterium panacisoli TaxID=1807141 RepID=A0A5D8ZYR6_9FLAO|nr:putative glycolipid-binding domain-containing protein [Chryseobacterium panacisoli]TZF99661.1 putative glycolipid-binding domain-containing protein [Chryseobacterium panacisoli]
MKTLVWRGILYPSLEYFNLQSDDKSYTVESKIIGCYEDKIFAVNYSILIDENWIVQSFLIESEINTIKSTFAGKRIQDQWEINNTISPEFNGCEFIDISLTPFTNTLPINNLKLQESISQKIDVLYIDVLNQQIRPVQQQYTRTAINKYLYENIENDFKAEISVDETGLVISYPELFEKIAEL